MSQREVLAYIFCYIQGNFMITLLGDATKTSNANTLWFAVAWLIISIAVLVMAFVKTSKYKTKVDKSLINEWKSLTGRTYGEDARTDLTETMASLLKSDDVLAKPQLEKIGEALSNGLKGN